MVVWFFTSSGVECVTCAFTAVAVFWFLLNLSEHIINIYVTCIDCHKCIGWFNQSLDLNKHYCWTYRGHIEGVSVTRLNRWWKLKVCHYIEQLMKVEGVSVTTLNRWWKLKMWVSLNWTGGESWRCEYP
jgi:hypothetical protein